MAGPSTGRPVTVTMGAVLTLHLKPPPVRPPRLSVGAAVTRAVLIVTQVFFGVVYFKDCPQQPNIPNFLLGLALTSLLMIPYVTLPCESEAAQPQETPRGCKACLLGLMTVFLFTWILAGDVWIFSVYQPNYDPAAADGLYCDKTLYTFALWTAVWETFVILVVLARLCRSLLCYVTMSPAPANRDFYGNKFEKKYNVELVKGAVSKETKFEYAWCLIRSKYTEDIKKGIVLLEDRVKELVSKSLQARDMAYCPYSHFAVGAAILTADGAIITGCNVENASYGLAMCAERTAIQRAVAEGHRQFTAIAVSADVKDRFIAPCGACRQVLQEFASDWIIYLTKLDGTFRETTLSQLLPFAFTPADLTNN